MPTVGLDLGGTKILGVRLGADGAVEDESRVATPAGGAELVDALVDLARRLGSGDAVGVGAAGMIDDDGVVRYAPNIPTFRDFPLRARLAEALDLPVVVDNDANVAALGEVEAGAAQGVRHALVITLGTGIGGGIVIDGRPYRGAHGFAAEIGHFQVVADGPVCACGEVGHWEALASGTALGELGRERARLGRLAVATAAAGGDPEAVTGIHVGDAAQAGDADANAVVAEYADRVAIGLAGLVNILDPELVAIAGGLVELGDVLLDPLRRSLHARMEGADARPPVRVVPASLGERAGAIGAAYLARGVAVHA